MPTAQQSIEIDVPPEKFFGVLRDYASYPEFLPEVRSVKVGRRHGNAVEVTYVLDIKIKQFEFTLQHVEDPSGRRIDWRLVRGELIRRDVGAWTLEETASGGTRVTYAIELDLAPIAPAALQQALAQRGLPNMLANFKARAEKLFSGK
jgi:ribosome-associated toxin RatA of RatAB toxin-antitoxin module